ncbi:DNA repair protein Rad50 [Leptospira gomenensis]|uniref:DNA repair protein Rad50 n=1 Tax=Leptospira gomenensis TaxID=2484974 RepID=A0A5F1YL66_9LEPT|nr:AAA family ATPase [Leptospira gomenensis]TGK33320.1 DNA repair protein Rad50 [Leptospira gomenensis]TGK37384.1 DNA repair protein Rad50 [Leptospira gomenensis]TGK50872.1 DNA repair protein Rad50 [Leptospira gomenensis]TGK56495.1 DNA repair protein Rad50 [Leptospira gomenensis]
MLKSIQMISFGRFSDVKFEFGSDATVFLGKNESGKTTIFDAMRLALGSGLLTASQEPKKSILARYGEKCAEGYKLFGEIPKLTKEAAPQYVHCVSLREGELEFSFLDNRFIKADFLRSRLFNNKVNLEGVSSSLKKIHSPHPNSGEFPQFEKLKTEIEILKSDRTRLVSQINELHSRNRNNLQKDSDSAKDKERVSEIENLLQNIEKENVLENKIQKKNKLLESLSELQKLKLGREKLKENFRYSKDESSSFESIVKEADVLLVSCSASETLLLEKRKNVETKKRESEELQTRSTTLQKMKSRAEEFFEKIESASRENGFKEEIRTESASGNSKLVGLIVSLLGGFGLLGTLITFLVSSASPLLLLTCVSFSGALIGIGFYLFSRKHTEVVIRHSMEKEKEFVKKSSGEWNVTFPETQIPALERLENLRQFLSKQIQNFEFVLQKIDSLKEEIVSLEKECDSIDIKVKRERQKLRELTSSKEAWLSERQVHTIQDYHKRIAEFQAADKHLVEISRRLTSERSVQTPEEVEILYKTELVALDEIPSGPVDENRKTVREMRKKELQSELQNLQDRLNELKLSVRTEDTRIKDSLPEKENELIQTLQKLSDREKEFSDLESRRRSARLAQEIIEEISKDQSVQFSSVASEIEKDLHLLLSERKINVEAIDKKEGIKMQDRSGTLRSIDHLSGGTLAVFYLVFKLFLARKTVPKKGILLLDEPFIHLDPERTETALNYLRNFAKETEYQILFFTKQDELASKIRNCFENTNLIRL